MYLIFIDILECLFKDYFLFRKKNDFYYCDFEYSNYYLSWTKWFFSPFR